MPSCFSLTARRDACYRTSFHKSGLRSTTTDLGDGTVVHCWAPRAHSDSKPTLVLIHGFGANAMWQFGGLLPALRPHFNLYVPDLLFFGDSHTSRPDRSESFQATAVSSALASLLPAGAPFHLFGISYGGFVAYRIAEQAAPGRVGRVVLACAGVCLEERDMEAGMFRVGSVDEAAEILLPRSPAKVRELFKLVFHKPPPSGPSCFLDDFIEVLCTEYRQEKKELIYALHKDRKLSDLPRITQPTLIVWGEHDQLFPIELGHRLRRHIGENAEMVIIKNVAHALNVEKPKELLKHLKSFLLTDRHCTTPPSKGVSHNNGNTKG